MKPITSLLLILLTITFSCAQNEPNELVFSVGGAPAEIDFWEELAEDFTRQTGIKITLNRQPTDTDQRRQGLVVALKAESRDPDIFLMDVAWVAQIAASGWLVDLHGFIQADSIDLDKFYQNVIELADRYQDKLLALPVYVDGGLLYYRVDLLNEYGYTGPPETWEMLIEMADSIQPLMREEIPDFNGYVWQGAQYEGLICNFLEVTVSGGGGIVDKDGVLEIDSDRNRQALDLMIDFVHTYRISPANTYTEFTEEEVRLNFQQGKALFERNRPYAHKPHQAEYSPVRDKFDIAQLPHFEGGRSVATLGGWHIGISQFSDRSEDAWEFVKFVTSYEIQKKLALRLGWNPGRKDVYSDQEVLAKLPHFADLKEVFEKAYPRPTVPYYTQISEVLQKHLNSALAGEVTSKQALSRAAEELKTVVERYSR
jgi:multiple sugar transport system substrate-binding protein